MCSFYADMISIQRDIAKYGYNAVIERSINAVRYYRNNRYLSLSFRADYALAKLVTRKTKFLIPYWKEYVAINRELNVIRYNKH